MGALYSRYRDGRTIALYASRVGQLLIASAHLCIFKVLVDFLVPVFFAFVCPCPCALIDATLLAKKASVSMVVLR